MAQLSVKPTRMELQNLKKRLTVAVRGHKLMKDKRDELVRRFIGYARKADKLRSAVEGRLAEAMRLFSIASSKMTPYELEEALSAPACNVRVESSFRSELSVPVPKLDIEIKDEEFKLPYSYSNTVYELDRAVAEFHDILPMLLELAEVESTCSILADEIEKTRRRVNALEHVMIPRFEETIRVIKMKLDENERGNVTRLMKTREMLENK